MSQVIPIPSPSKSLPKMVIVVMKYQSSVTVQVKGVKFESISMKTQSPIKIVDNRIRVDEYQMEDDEPYAFRYLDKTYMLTRTNRKLTLYELQ